MHRQFLHEAEILIKQATEKDNAAACIRFLNFLAFIWPEADRAVCFSGLIQLFKNGLFPYTPSRAN
jgi:hypothetical protein